MEKTYIILILFGTVLGLFLIYLLLRSSGIVGKIPIISDVIDPIFSTANNTFRLTIQESQKKDIRAVKSKLERRIPDPFNPYMPSQKRYKLHETHKNDDGSVTLTFSPRGRQKLEWAENSWTWETEYADKHQDFVKKELKDMDSVSHVLVDEYGYVDVTVERRKK